MQMSGKLPEDIQKTVGEVLGRPGERMGVDQYMGLSLRVGLALAAERERCARIAETDTDWTPFQRNSKREALTGAETNAFAPPADDGTYPSAVNLFAYTTGIAAGRAIAAAIRKPTPYPAWQKLSD